MMCATLLAHDLIKVLLSVLSEDIVECVWALGFCEIVIYMIILVLFFIIHLRKTYLFIPKRHLTLMIPFPLLQMNCLHRLSRLSHLTHLPQRINILDVNPDSDRDIQRENLLGAMGVHL